MTERDDLTITTFRNIIIAILYWITGRLSFAFFQQDSIVTVTVFIPEGIALAGVILYGYRVIPSIFFGQLILALSSGLTLAPAFGISAVNAIEAAIAYKLFEYFKLDKTLLHFRDLIGLFLLIIFVLQPFSSLFGNIVLYLLHLTKESNFLQNIFFWWFGNVVGQLLVAPMVLIIYFNRQKSEFLKYLYTVLFFLLFNYILQVVFEINNTSLLLIIVLPLSIYLATVSLPYATIATFTLVISSLFFFHLGIGTFAYGISQIDKLININFFTLSNIILVLIVGVIFREKEIALERLHAIAHYDQLTGVPNRRVLEDEIRHSIYLFENLRQESMICFIDIDKFKSINDKYGHIIGDKLLKEVTERIKLSIRSTDRLLRLGGDEFILILNNVNIEQAKLTLSRVIDNISMLEYIDNHRISVTISIGVANCPKDGTNEKDLLQAADKAMYRAKKEGKNCIVFTENCLNDVNNYKESLV